MGPKNKTNISEACGSKAADLLKMPFISMGILLGGLAVPPLTKIASDAQDKAKIISGAVRVGAGKKTILVPSFIINKTLRAGARRARKKVGVFSPQKRALHHFVVTQMPKQQNPLTLDYIAAKLDLAVEEVAEIVDELEKDKTFLFRKDSGAVNWAYPVTTDETPHKVFFSSGERINAA